MSKKRYQFQFSRLAEKVFSSLDMNARSRILRKLEYFETLSDPLAFAKKMVGVGNYFCFRIGAYRVIVSPMDDGSLVVLLVVKIGHRRDVYKS